MDKNLIFDRKAIIFSLIFFLTSWLLFFVDTKELMQSFFASLIAASLAWLSYIIVRIVYLALRS